MNKKIRILIVEDEVAIREGLIDVFIYHGYDVDFSGDGAQGLEKALTGQYDLIVLDVMLPNLNGFEICNQIRLQDREQAIIMLTAKSADEDIIEGLSLGADDYVAKPFSVAQLVLRVQAVLRRTRNINDQDQQIQLAEGVSIDCQNLSGKMVIKPYLLLVAKLIFCNIYWLIRSDLFHGTSSYIRFGVMPTI